MIKLNFRQEIGRIFKDEFVEVKISEESLDNISDFIKYVSSDYYDILEFIKNELRLVVGLRYKYSILISKIVKVCKKIVDK